MHSQMQYYLHGIKVFFTKPKRIIRVFKNALYDFKYSRRYLGIPLHNQNDIAGFTNTTSTEYYVLDKLFSQVSINTNDVIVDVGCGRGRVLVWLIRQKIKNRLIGIEVDPLVANDTQKRMKPYKQVSVTVGDITEEAFPTAGTIFYLFNPFNEIVLKKFVAKLEDNITSHTTRDGYPIIIYYNCAHLNVFENNPNWTIKKRGDFDGLPSAIISGSQR